VGAFTSSLTGLTENTTYYVRAYATNSVGTAYGNELNFTTTVSNLITDIDRNQYNTIQIGNQIWLKEILKVTHFRNGDIIPIGLTVGELLNTTNPAYNFYDDNLYN